MSHLKMDELPEQTAWELWLPKNEHGDNIEAGLEVCLCLTRFLKHTYRDHWSSPAHIFPWVPTHSGALMGTLQIHLLPVGIRVNKEPSANLQETSWMKNSAFYRWSRVPTTRFCYANPEPEGQVQFSFWTHFFHVYDPHRPWNLWTCTKWRSSAQKSFWGVPVPALTEVWLLTIPE